MKGLLLLFITFLSVGLLANQDMVLNGRYAIGRDFDVYSLEKDYELTPAKKGSEDGMFYVQFKDSVFSLYEFTGCGNQCKRSLKGTYLINGTQLFMSNIEISVNTYFKDKGTYKSKEKLYFDVLTTSEGIKFRQQEFPFKAKLKEAVFRTSGILFENRGRDSYELTSFERKENTFTYGNFVEFKDSTFSAYYTAPCGNDCFTDLIGIYSFISKDVISINVTSITKSDFCGKIDKPLLGDYGEYRLTINPTNNIFLTKIKTNTK